MRLKASGDKFEIRQNYIPTLNDRIFGEFKEVFNMMDNDVNSVTWSNKYFYYYRKILKVR